LYGAGVLQSLLPLMLPREFPVKISIVQPRLSRKPFTWETTVGWIEDTAIAARGPAAAAVAYATDRATKETFSAYPEVAGSHCQYCRRKSQCVVFKSHVAKASKPISSGWDPVVFSMRSTIKGYLEELEQFALDQALVGNVLEGTKLVRGRNGNAQLQIPQEEVRALAKGLNIESAIVEMKESWATPAKIRDAFKKTGMADAALKAIVKSPEGSLQIADAADPRPVAVLSTEGNASAFEGVAKAVVL
jgi:hypothetical protein